MTILDTLEDDSVVMHELTRDSRTLCVTEGYSFYYGTNLNKQEAQQYVNELQALVDQMKE